MYAGRTIIGSILGIMITLTCGVAPAQDLLVADTIRLATVEESLYGPDQYTNPMPVYLFNDEVLESIVIPLLIDGYSGWATFDSVSYVGSRLEDPLILDQREAFVFATDTFSVASLVLRFESVSGALLPPGAGQLCEIWFTPRFGGEVALDSLPDSPYGGLRLTGSSLTAFTPQFHPGVISIACNYMIGDLRTDGYIRADDLLGFFKGCLGCFWYDLDDPSCMADLNCDRHVDSRDGCRLVEYYFHGHDTICSCGTYTPALYNDPGIPDTIWVTEDTLYVGFEQTIEIGITNDEPITAVAIALEWDGDAILQWLYYDIWTPIGNYLGLTSYECYANDLINPDTLYMASFACMADNPVQPGSAAVSNYPVTPLTPGTATFRIVRYWTGPETMFVTEAEEAILPVMGGGHITVVYLCGDANNDMQLNVGDAVFLINFIFKEGQAPNLECLADVNDDGIINVGDAVYMINFIFKQGMPPVENCCP